MKDQFKLPSNITKAALIDRYKTLLEAYREKSAKAEAIERERSETDKKEDSAALRVGDDTSVQSVVEAVGQLRVLIGNTLNDLTEQLTERADQLGALRRAVRTREARLENLVDTEAAADTLSKLMEVYAEREREAQATFELQVAEFEGEFAEKRQALETEIAAARAEWKAERERAESELKEAAELRDKERTREEEDYLYERNRTRKLEEHDYEQRRTAQERELEQQRIAVESDLAAREALVAERETVVDQLQRRVDGFPEELEGELARLRTAITGELTASWERKLEHLQLERQWEQRVATERATHLEGTIAELKAQNESQKKDLATAQKQLQSLADKSIEGTSLLRLESLHSSRGGRRRDEAPDS